MLLSAGNQMATHYCGTNARIDQLYSRSVIRDKVSADGYNLVIAAVSRYKYFCRSLALIALCDLDKNNFATTKQRRVRSRVTSSGEQRQRCRKISNLVYRVSIYLARARTYELINVTSPCNNDRM